MNPLVFTDSIDIEAPAGRVWRVLTDPELTKQYMFGCKVVSDWQIGSPILWKGSSDAKIHVKGHLVKLEHEKSLHYTVFNPNMGIEDTPANYLTVTYEFVPKGSHTTLEVTQGDFAAEAIPEAHYNDVVAAWSAVLPKIKEIAER